MSIRRWLGLALSAAILTFALVPAAAIGSGAARFWPQWRGPLGTGEAPHAMPPLEWSATRNVAWKIPIPGIGKSTPVVWDGLVVLTTAVPVSTGPDAELAFTVLAYDRASGALRWQRVVRTERPHEGHHRDGTFASPSAILDGERVYAFFGSRGLYALDPNGTVLWEKDLGDMQTRMSFGEGASAALHDGTLVVTWDHQEDDFVAAFDAATGREKWRQTRDEPTTWATPHILTHAGRAQVVVNGTNRLIGYDLESGDVIWQTQGTTLNVIPSPVSADGIVYATAGFRGSSLKAIRLEHARGELTGPPAVAFTYDRDTPYVPSPLVYRGGLYFLKSNSGILTQLDAKTGAVHYTQRLEAVPNVYASPVGAAGRVYIVGREGTTLVLEAGPEYKVLATNALDEAIDASPALVDGEIYLRGTKHLYRISE